jgi:hypothetical protein
VDYGADAACEWGGRIWVLTVLLERAGVGVERIRPIGLGPFEHNLKVQCYWCQSDRALVSHTHYRSLVAPSVCPCFGCSHPAIVFPRAQSRTSLLQPPDYSQHSEVFFQRLCHCSPHSPKPSSSSRKLLTS